MVDVTWIDGHGLIAELHDHDPDEVLAAAGGALEADTDLNRLGRRREIPLTALPEEAWWGTYVVDNPNHPEHGKTVEGFVQEHHPDARPVTVVNVHPKTATAATARAKAAGKPVVEAKRRGNPQSPADTGPGVR